MKIALYVSAWLIWFVTSLIISTNVSGLEMDAALNSLKTHGTSVESTNISLLKNTVNIIVPFLLVLTGVFMFGKKLMNQWKKLMQASLILSVFFLTGCLRGYEPQKYEVINTYEEGFMLPFTDDAEKQTSSNNEEYLAKNLVYAQQIRIPQRWIQTGYLPGSGDYRDAALFIKVDKSPVTREWTADIATGTSNKVDAIWVQTADGVEFSTGWTCTARILSKEDAVKFLHNYRNETLAQVLDTEVRAKIQTEFGMEVTDLHMQELRTNATPHLTRVIEVVDKFFLTRGITITNLGITGGFVFQDKSIKETLVKVFNAEQEKNIAMAATAAQSEKNKTIQLTAEAKAKAIVAEKEGEAQGIRAVAEAKLFEVEKAQENLDFYMQLKKIEVQKAQIEKWDGKFPYYMMGGNPNMLMMMPEEKTAKKE